MNVTTELLGRWMQNPEGEHLGFNMGLFVFDIPTFNESVVREAILNAVSHRDYRLPGSVFVRQCPRKLAVVSPGRFPPDVTPENILWRQSPRNRRIAEAFARCGLVERAGQGYNRIFEECIKESKPKPDFAGTDNYQVAVSFQSEVQDAQFLRFLEQVGKERLAAFATKDFLVLDIIHREQAVPERLKPRLRHLVDIGILETIGRGRGARTILSRRLYNLLGQRGVYTRKRGLDRETNKALLLQHIRGCGAGGCKLQELRQVLPSLSANQIQSLLKTLKAEGSVYCVGRTRAASWYPAPQPLEGSSHPLSW